MAADDRSDTLHAVFMEEDADKRIKALRQLIENGTDVKSYSDDYTALIEAASYGYDECVGILLEAGADVNLADRLGKTALIHAASNGNNECLRLLVEAGADVNHSDDEEKTALMAAAREGHEECVRVLLEAGANVNKSDKSGEAALLHAASEGNVRCMRLLLNAGADVNHSDRYGFTTLIEAATLDNDKCVECLLEAGVDVNHSDCYGRRTALMEAARLDNVECVRCLLKADSNVNDADEEGRTALIHATNNGHVESARMLLGAGANVNQSDINGDTALTYCLLCYKYNYKNDTKACLKLLINTGADIDARNNKSLQPIHYALKLRPFLKFLAEYLISENCTLSQASYDNILATYNIYVDEELLKEKDRLDVLKLVFACGLPCHLCQSYIVKQETSVRNWVETVASQPHALKSICIFEIRRNLGLGIKSKVTKLNLPNVIQNMILLKGILNLDCFD